MQATIRRYEGVDAARTDEVVERVNETLVPQLRELHGFSGYYVIDAGNGVISSVSPFETSEQAEESTKLVAEWIADENLETAIPNSPKITSGKVLRTATGWSPSPSSSVLRTLSRGASVLSLRQDDLAVRRLAEGPATFSPPRVHERVHGGFKPDRVHGENAMCRDLSTST